MRLPRMRALEASHTLVLAMFFCACSDNGATPEQFVPPDEYEAKLMLSRLSIETYPPPGSNVDSVNCPRFIFWERPFHVGDTLAIIVSQAFGAQFIGSQAVMVNVTSKFGDSEDYLLKNGFWPCETRIVDIEIYRSIIVYNTIPLGAPPYALANNGELEIRTTGDTLVATYVSHYSGKLLRDSVAVLPQ